MMYIPATRTLTYYIPTPVLNALTYDDFDAHLPTHFLHAPGRFARR